jgi:transposase
LHDTCKTDSQQEQWKAIPGYEGLYEASSLGRVRSLAVRVKINGRWRSYKGNVLRPGTRRSGRQHYLQVSLSKNGEIKSWGVHQLVLFTFVSPYPSGMECCHNDGDGVNNRLENLRYDTPKGNWADRRRHGTDNSGSKHPCSKFTEDEVVAIRDEYARGGVTSRQLAERYKVNPKGIYNILSRRTWKQAGGADCSERLKRQATKPNAKLTKEQVLKIRRLHEDDGWDREDLIEKFNVSRSTVNKVLSRRTWSDI